jgi:hypothetical protein
MGKMSNLPPGADNYPLAPYNQIDKICPQCGGTVTVETERVKIKGRWHEWENLECLNPECGWKDSNEEDWDND